MLTAILGIFVSIASLLLIAWLFYKGAEKSQQTPRVRRAFFVGMTVIYVASMVIGIFEVIQGKESPQILLGLPGGLLLIWLYLKAAAKFRTPS